MNSKVDDVLMGYRAAQASDSPPPSSGAATAVVRCWILNGEADGQSGFIRFVIFLFINEGNVSG
jgi:hypothetical protein